MDIFFDQAFILPIVFALLAATLMISGIYLIIQSGRSRFWLGARARITYSVLEETKDHKVLPDGTRETTNRVEPVIQYRYNVRGKMYQGNLLRFGNKPFTMGSARRLIQKYPRGAKTHIHYNPVKPEESVLIGSAGWLGLLLILFGILLGAAAGLINYLIG